MNCGEHHNCQDKKHESQLGKMAHFLMPFDFLGITFD
jgi:hypothetical protein